MLQIHLASHDATLLDRSLGSLVPVVRETGAKLVGPIPLPVQREDDGVTHRRRLVLTEVGADTIERLNSFFVPAAIDINISM